MAGRGVRLRGAVLATALGVVGGLVVLSSQVPAQAATVDVNLDYRCKGGIADSGSAPVFLSTTLTIPTTLNVGDPLNVSWKLAYRDQSRFGSPGRFPAGATVSVLGNIKLTNGWVGVLQPKGSVTQGDPLIPGTPLTLPEGISDFAHTDRPGTVRLTPDKLFVDFTPPAGELMINDDDPAILYTPPTGSGGADSWRSVVNRPPEHNDHNLNFHRTRTAGETATLAFTGTGIEYVGQRDHRAGPVDIILNSQPGTPPRVDPSKNDDGTDVTLANLGGQTLWSFTDLPYGNHTITIKNVQNKRMVLDAFRVITKELPEPPEQYRATCTLISKPVSVDVTIGEGGTVPPITESPTDGVTPSGGVTPTDGVTPPTTHSPGAMTPSPPLGLGPGEMPTPRPTWTTTVTATAAPQVRVTPIGAAQTGEAPERHSGVVLIGVGALLLTGGALGGLALHRRRAAHSGGEGTT